MEKTKGQWGAPFDLDNVPVHATLLPDKRILYWGRRDDPKNETDHDTLNQTFTNVFTWHTETLKKEKVASPKDTKGRTVNLFCSGHTLLPDGTVFVVGGHIVDTRGLKQACIYDPKNNTWTPQDPMNDGRWYPSVMTLPDGTAFVASGSHAMPPKPGRTDITVLNNVNPQIWLDSENGWVSAPPTPNAINALYPRLHLDPKGNIFMVGPQQKTMFLIPPDAVAFNTGDGDPDWGRWKWDNEKMRTEGWRNEGSSVMYDSGKILYTGGGGGPSFTVESIDLNDPNPQWQVRPNLGSTSKTDKSGRPRRHHNATVLPDGTVLVNGGTSGGREFNDLRDGKPVHEPELWDPSTDTWTKLAAEDFDRCYHSVTLLLPDGQVLSAGGGEYQPDDLFDAQGKATNNRPGTVGKPNPAKDSITKAQLFKPPYFFKNQNNARPSKPVAPAEIIYDRDFEITVGASDVIKKVSLVRLGSVTHGCNMNQSLMFLEIKKRDGARLTVEAPSNPVLAPPGPSPPAKVKLATPGYYMLFVLDEASVPSVAPIVQVKAAPAADANKPPVRLSQRVADAAPQIERIDLLKVNDKIIADQDRPDVAVGLIPSCPYGLGACWGGAFDSLQSISDVEVVRPIPSQDECVAYVYTKQDILPDIDVWRSEFQKVANYMYVLRGIEVTLSGKVARKNINGNDQFTIVDDSHKAEVILAQLQEGSKVQWDRTLGKPKPSTTEEEAAFARLSKAVTQHKEGLNLEVTGPLQKSDVGVVTLEVREWKVVDTS